MDRKRKFEDLGHKEVATNKSLTYVKEVNALQTCDSGLTKKRMLHDGEKIAKIANNIEGSPEVIENVYQFIENQIADMRRGGQDCSYIEEFKTDLDELRQKPSNDRVLDILKNMKGKIDRKEFLENRDVLNVAWEGLLDKLSVEDMEGQIGKNDETEEPDKKKQKMWDPEGAKSSSDLNNSGQIEALLKNIQENSKRIENVSQFIENQIAEMHGGEQDCSYIEEFKADLDELDGELLEGQGMGILEEIKRKVDSDEYPEVDHCVFRAAWRGLCDNLTVQNMQDLAVIQDIGSEPLKTNTSDSENLYEIYYQKAKDLGEQIRGKEILKSKISKLEEELKDLSNFSTSSADGSNPMSAKDAKLQGSTKRSELQKLKSELPKTLDDIRSLKKEQKEKENLAIEICLRDLIGKDEMGNLSMKPVDNNSSTFIDMNTDISSKNVYDDTLDRIVTMQDLLANAYETLNNEESCKNLKNYQTVLKQVARLLEYASKQIPDCTHIDILEEHKNHITIYTKREAIYAGACLKQAIKEENFDRGHPLENFRDYIDEHIDIDEVVDNIREKMGKLDFEVKINLSSFSDFIWEKKENTEVLRILAKSDGPVRSFLLDYGELQSCLKKVGEHLDHKVDGEAEVEHLKPLFHLFWQLGSYQKRLQEKFTKLKEAVQAEKTDSNKGLDKLNKTDGIKNIERVVIGGATWADHQPNQDGSFADEKRAAMVVCDGVSATENAQIASKSAIDTFKDALDKFPNEAIYDYGAMVKQVLKFKGIRDIYVPKFTNELKWLKNKDGKENERMKEMKLPNVEEVIKEMSEKMVKKAHNDLKEKTKDYDNDVVKPATTMLALKVIDVILDKDEKKETRGKCAIVVNIGDTRLYRITSDNKIQQLTLDNADASMIADPKPVEVEVWKAQAEIAEYNNFRNAPTELHPYIRARNQVDRVIGDDEKEELNPAGYAFLVEKGEMLIGASDGLFDNLSDPEIRDCAVMDIHNPNKPDETISVRKFIEVEELAKFMVKKAKEVAYSLNSSEGNGTVNIDDYSFEEMNDERLRGFKWKRDKTDDITVKVMGL